MPQKGKRSGAQSVVDALKELPAFKEVENGQWVFVFIWELTETVILCSKRETALGYASEFLLAWCKALKDDDDFDEEAKDVKGLLDEEKITEAVKVWQQASGGMILMHPVVEQKNLDRRLVALEPM